MKMAFQMNNPLALIWLHFDPPYSPCTPAPKPDEIFVLHIKAVLVFSVQPGTWPEMILSCLAQLFSCEIQFQSYIMLIPVCSHHLSSIPFVSSLPSSLSLLIFFFPLSFSLSPLPPSLPSIHLHLLYFPPFT